VLAESLCVEPDFFLEYRLRQVAWVLDRAPALADKLYGILLRDLPVPDDFAESLKRPGNAGSGGNGGGGTDRGGNGGSARPTGPAVGL